MAKREKREPPREDHPALMPKLAWRDLIEHVIAEHDFKHKYRFAEAVDVADQTISRWLGKRPPLPDYVSFERVAVGLGISLEELAARWAAFMSQRYAAAYMPGAAADSDVKEPAPGYDESDLLAQAEEIGRYDLNAVPVEQRPSLFDLGREVRELVAEFEEARRRFLSRLRVMLRRFRQVYQGAVDTARRIASIQGG